MIRFYKNKTPQKGEIVVVSIKTNENSIITCDLLEYEGIEGVICRADVSRNKARVYNSLEEGKIIPVICLNVDVKENGTTYIDLNYVTMDKEQINHYKDRYDKILKIINIFSWIAGSSLEEFNDLEYSEYLNNPKIKYIVQNMLSDNLYMMTKDEICELFFENVYKLYEVLPSWTKCNTVPNFLEKMMERFPRPSISILLNINFQSSKCFGIKEIRKLSNNVTMAYQEFDKDINIEFSVLSTPLFRVVIKSDKINNTNYQQYYDIISSTINNFSNLDTLSQIVSCDINTSSGMKTEFKIISVETESVDEATTI